VYTCYIIDSVDKICKQDVLNKRGLCTDKEVCTEKQLRSQYTRSMKHVTLRIYMRFNRFNPHTGHKSALFAYHIHSFHSLSYYRPIASSKSEFSIEGDAVLPFSFPCTLTFLNVIQYLLTSSSSSSRHFYPSLCLSFNNVFYKQFLNKMRPIQLAFLLFIVQCLLLPFLTQCIISPFSHDDML